ncbi:hypothetical protein CEXT_304041 [Caerostris extrusa]|uniref:Uncharacterized protein n=1 Tax=Caerostris extrusa TaxID=172846 RepID=A0AAV4MGK0_CAEEX|nr:hypothetical protein CEXT_304041 [Caerostris extrusa]
MFVIKQIGRKALDSEKNVISLWSSQYQSLRKHLKNLSKKKKRYQMVSPPKINIREERNKQFSPESLFPASLHMISYQHNIPTPATPQRPQSSALAIQDAIPIQPSSFSTDTVITVILHDIDGVMPKLLADLPSQATSRIRIQ